MIRKTLPLLIALGASVVCHAAQVRVAKDGATIEAAISREAPTRILIEGERIVDVVGNVHSSNGCEARTPEGATQAAVAPSMPTPAPNTRGDVILSCDMDKGEVYVRPVGIGEKPISLFVSSPRATYTLLLRRADIPADTLIIDDRSARLFGAAGGERPQRAASHVRALKAMLVAMTSAQPSKEFRVEEVERPLALWKEADFKLVKLVEGRNLIGEVYTLANVSAGPMVLAEQEFDREEGGVVAVAIEHHNLQPREMTTVYVIRTMGELP
jgi:conjugal transfer pilus assembly protein TraK